MVEEKIDLTGNSSTMRIKEIPDWFSEPPIFCVSFTPQAYHFSSVVSLYKLDNSLLFEIQMNCSIVFTFKKL